LKADSGWLGGYPRNLCVTGTFTQSTQAQVAPRGPLSLGAYGDGLKRRRSPESVRPFGRLRTRRIRQDSAACVSLSSMHLSKSKSSRSATPHDGSAFAAPSRRERDLVPGPTRHGLVSYRRLLPTRRSPVRGVASRRR